MNRYKEELNYLLSKYKLTHSEIQNVTLWLKEMSMWNMPPLSRWWQEPEGQLKGKNLRQAALAPIKERWLEAKELGPQWSDSKEKSASHPIVFEEIHDNRSIMGACPVASEKTRCCNLLTLDAVFRCGFDCSYCSIQSFYSEGRISFHGNLREKLSHLNLDKSKLYHIGTGQSSDSLMWGNHSTGDDQGLLDELLLFARENPHVILEFKSKSDNVDWLLQNRDKIPFNALFTWSLNPQIVIDKEEGLTASLERRLAAAKSLADLGCAVGFHFHPMIYFDSWQEEYGNLFKRVTELFSSDQIVQVSLGTLTFIKPVLKKIRNRDFHSQILKMPLEESAGKFTYPWEIKREIFSFAYNSFKEWHDSSVYFYLCMEDSSLWEPVLGVSYKNNDEFEESMIQSYYSKLKKIGQKTL